MPKMSKKQVSISVSSMLVTEANKKEDMILAKLLWVCYLFCFYKNKKNEM